MSITGFWNVSISTPIGAQSVVLELIERGGAVKGIAKGNAESTPLLDPVLDGNRLTWKQSITKPMRQRTGRHQASFLVLYKAT